MRNEVPHAINAIWGNFLLRILLVFVPHATKEPIPKWELLSAKPVLQVELPPSKVKAHAKPVLQEKSQRWGHHASNHRTWSRKVVRPTNI